MKIAIIGAGVSGLTAARRAIEYNVEYVVFEMTDTVGGTWVYSEDVITDEHNVPIHASIYKSLRVNLPIQLMEFGDYKFEPESGLCYPGHEEVLKYIKDFSKKFNLYEHIKFQNLVQRVSKEPNGWQITVKNLQNQEIGIHYFDAVMICSGHLAKPTIPNMPGIEQFKGHLIHSYYYRDNSPYVGKRVLIVGSGPSGCDLSLDCAEVAHKVSMSCRTDKKRCIYHEKVEIKPRISSIDADSVKFIDGTTVEIDSIILCTGYEFHFPFIDSSCGITLSENRIVRPLFKTVFNIRLPTMCFIGLQQQTVVFPLVDLQVIVFMKYLTNEISLPSTDSMLQAEAEQHKQKVEAKIPATKYHFLGDEMEAYLKDLANFGQTDTIPNLYFKIYKKHHETWMDNYENVKKQSFKIINGESFLWELK